MSDLLSVEFDADCRNVYFPPLDRVIRGRFSPTRAAAKDPQAAKYINEWRDVPGQRLEIDQKTGAAELVEPLHFDEHKALAEKIKEKKKCKLAPPRERIDCDLPTLQHFVKLAVKSNQARLVSGTLPEKVTGYRTHFIVEPVENPLDHMAAAMTAQAQALSELAAAVADLRKGR